MGQILPRNIVDKNTALLHPNHHSRFFSQNTIPSLNMMLQSRHRLNFIACATSFVGTVRTLRLKERRLIGSSRMHSSNNSTTSTARTRMTSDSGKICVISWTSIRSRMAWKPVERRARLSFTFGIADPYEPAKLGYQRYLRQPCRPR